ncbi:unnamed protein product, partial [Boreogadus saida]
MNRFSSTTTLRPRLEEHSFSYLGGLWQHCYKLECPWIHFTQMAYRREEQDVPGLADFFDRCCPAHLQMADLQQHFIRTNLLSGDEGAPQQRPPQDPGRSR